MSAKNVLLRQCREVYKLFHVKLNSVTRRTFDFHTFIKKIHFDIIMDFSLFESASVNQVEYVLFSTTVKLKMLLHRTY